MTQPAPGSPRVRMIDVARAAGVSPMSVSRVMRNDPGVSPEVRRSVLAVAASLHYRPSEIARTLRAGHDLHPGQQLQALLLVPALEHVLILDLVRALMRNAKNSGCNLTLVNSGGPLRHHRQILQHRQQTPMDGLLSLRALDPASIEITSHIGESVQYQRLADDDFSLAFLTTQDLIARGLAPIVATRGGSDATLHGYLAAIRLAGMAPHIEDAATLDLACISTCMTTSPADTTAVLRQAALLGTHAYVAALHPRSPGSSHPATVTLDAATLAERAARQIAERFFARLAVHRMRDRGSSPA